MALDHPCEATTTREFAAWQELCEAVAALGVAFARVERARLSWANLPQPESLSCPASEEER